MRNNLIRKYRNSFFKKYTAYIIIGILFIMYPNKIFSIQGQNQVCLLIFLALYFLVRDLKTEILTGLRVSNNEISISSYSILLGKKTQDIDITDLLNLSSESVSKVQLEYNCVMGKNYKGGKWKSKIKNNYTVYLDPWDDVYFELNNLKKMLDLKR